LAATQPTHFRRTLDPTIGTLTVAITGGGHGDDVLGIMNIGNNANQTSVSGNSVYSSGQLIGTFSGGLNLAPLVVSLNSAATPGRTQTLLRNIAYRNAMEGSQQPPKVRI
jgi:hypothetical protein